MGRDLAHNVKVVQALANQQYSATTNGDIIDSKGYESLTFIISVGNNFAFDGSNYLTFTVQEGDDSGLSDAAGIASGNYLAPQKNGATWDRVLDATADGDAAFLIGVTLSAKRYYRLVMTETGTVTSAEVGAVAELGHPRHAPVF